MKVRMFAIRDTKTEIFHPPFYAHNEGHALRLVTDMAANPQSTLHSHPSDFSICEVGSFDDQTGVVEGMTTPRGIMFVDELVKGAGHE